MVAVRRIEDLIPVDPRVSMLLKAMFHAVAMVNDRVDRAQNKLAADTESKRTRVMLNLKRKVVGPVLEAWIDAFRKEKDLRGRCIRRTLNRDQYRAFAKWEELADERRQARRLMCKMVRAGEAKAWNRWLQYVEEHRCLAEEQQRLRRFMLRALNQQLSGAFLEWLDACRAQHRNRRYLARILNRQLARFFLVWADFNDARVAEQRKVRKGLFTGDLGRAWRQWEELGHHRRRMRKFLSRLLSRGVARAWSSWLDHLELIGRQRKILSRALNASVARAFDAWYDSLGEKNKYAAVLHRALNASLTNALIKVPCEPAFHLLFIAPSHPVHCVLSRRSVISDAVCALHRRLYSGWRLQKK